MPSLTTTHRTNPADTYTASLAHAVIHAAITNEDIAPTIQATILSTSWSETATTIQPAAGTIALTPDSALRTAAWLTATISPQSHPETTALLTTWAQQYEVPKDAIIGIVGIAIMGPTLGILDKPKKKKKAELPVIIESAAYETLSKAELVTLTSQLAQEVVAAELRFAHGNIYQMHPDTAEWCFEAGGTAVYVVDAETYQQITTTAKHAPHRVATDSEMIAFSPAIGEAITERFSLTRALE